MKNREREKQTDRQTDGRTDRGTDKQRHRETETCRDNERQTGRCRGSETDRQGKRGEKEPVTVCWLLNVPATCECISGTDLHRQFYVLPH